MSDLISRQEVIDALYDWSNHTMTDAEAWHLRQVIGDIKSIPSAEPERIIKIGQRSGKTLESAIDYLHSVGWLQEHDRILTESAEPERTAKVEQAVPNMTILRRKVDLQSILQAIKTDKIRVWLNYDGKICFQNTKTGNKISVKPYYDMNGEKFDE